MSGDETQTEQTCGHYHGQREEHSGTFEGCEREHSF